MIKAILVDGDGVVLKKRGKYFSDRLREDGYDFSKEEEKKFFKDVYPDIRLGRLDLEKEIGKRVSAWGWDKSAEELLVYWFSSENNLDQLVLDSLQKKRQSEGVKLYLASDHSKYRANDLWENVGLKKYFDGHFFSCDLGVTKDNPEFYKNVLAELNLQPNEVLFIDDEEENVSAARSLGMPTILYDSESGFARVIRS